MKRLTLLFSLILLINNFSYSQLAIGNIAFIGYNTDSGPGASDNDGFSFIALTDIPGSTIIYFTEEGWNDDLDTWVGNTEGHIQWTAPAAGITCGTVVYITESTADNFTVTGGGTATLASGASWNLSGGDQVLAYQAAVAEPATIPTFIAAINGNDGDADGLDPVTLWDEAATILASPSKSCLPFGLSNGANCVALFTTPLTEQDNAKYTGTLTGTSTALRAAINDRTNWSFDDVTAYDINPGAYSPSVTCLAPCTNPTVPTVTFAPGAVCAGGTVTLTISGTLNDAVEWKIYSGSCGGTLVGTTAGTTFDVTPAAPSTTYFVRGEGGCVTPGSCGSVTVTVTPEDDPSFNYDVSSYCPNGTDPTPTVSLAGGTFTFDPAGLVIDGSTGIIDLSASDLGTFTITYTTSGSCPSASSEMITIEDNDAPVPNLAVLPVISAECEITLLTSPTATDGCGGVVTVTNDVSLPINEQGTTIITWTYTDEYGNSSTQTQNAVIDDITAPVPDEIPLTDFVTACEINELPMPTATDNCEGDIDVTNDAVFPITEPTTVIWTYDDGNGNTVTQSQNIEFAPIDVSTIVSGAITINANNTDATAYQWINCDDSSPIDGATEASYTAGANGTYAVIITEGECSDTSDCVTINQVNLNEELNLLIQVYPNPTNTDFFSIQSPIEIKQVEILDLNGRILLTENNINDGKINISALSSGAYVIIMQTVSGEYVQKRLNVLN